MTTDLEVKVLWGVDRNDPSEPQGGAEARAAEQGSAGSDGMTVDEPLPHLREHWSAIREAVQAGTTGGEWPATQLFIWPCLILTSAACGVRDLLRDLPVPIAHLVACAAVERS